MADAEGFQGQLEAALERKRRYLEDLALPRLKEVLQAHQTVFENLYNVLLRKSLVQEDPYKYEQKLTEVTIPAKGTIGESEKREKLSQRLSEYHSQLEFLNTYYQFSLEFLNLERVKRIIGLVQYVNWLHLTETSPDATTAVLAETLARLRLTGGDSMAVGVVSNSVRQLEAQSKQALAHLRELLSFQREAYKLGIRSRLLASLGPTLSKLYPAGVDKAYSEMRAAFVQRMKGEPFYRDLVTELLHEEYGGEAGELRQSSLDKLRIPEAKNEVKRQALDHRSVLMEALRLLLPAGGYLADAVKKLSANQEILRGKRGGLRAWLRKVFRRRVESVILDIRYFESATSTTRSERLDLNGFLAQMRKKVALFTALADPSGPAAARVSGAPEEQLLAFVGKNIGELQRALRRLEGAAEALRVRAAVPEREQMKGIRIELSGLKNCLVRSNKRRYEYIARKEDEEQLRKLGVAPTPAAGRPAAPAPADQTE